MSGEIIDITTALEARQFKAKEDRVQKIRDAFRASRLDAKGEAKANSPTLKSVKAKKKGRKTKR